MRPEAAEAFAARDVAGSGMIAMMRFRAGTVLVVMLVSTALAMLAAPASAATRAVVLDVDGVIGPAVADYVVRELRDAQPGDVGIVVLRMNTPGGLDSSMREIVSAILASPVPVATYVAPSGARAASAGTYIAYASAIAAMAPGTNIGAATPIQIGGNPLPSGGSEQEKQEQGKSSEPANTETRKIVNDAVAYIRSLATLNGRNVDWATDAVRSAASLPASEALTLHVVDVIANDVPDLLRQIDGRTVTVVGKPQRLATAGLEVETIPPDWRTELLGLVTNPNVAFILMLIGIYGLILEFFSPGAVAPGLVGAISLLVALYALALLPINYAGAAPRPFRHRTDDRRGPHRRLRRPRCRRHCGFRHRRADDVSLARAGFCAFQCSGDRRGDRQRRSVAVRAGGGAALAQAAGRNRQRGSYRRRRRGGVLGGKRGQRAGQGRNLAGAGRRVRSAPGTAVKVVSRDGLVLLVQSI